MASVYTYATSISLIHIEHDFSLINTDSEQKTKIVLVLQRLKAYSQLLGKKLEPFLKLRVSFYALCRYTDLIVMHQCSEVRHCITFSKNGDTELFTLNWIICGIITLSFLCLTVSLLAFVISVFTFLCLCLSPSLPFSSSFISLPLLILSFPLFPSYLFPIFSLSLTSSQLCFLVHPHRFHRLQDFIHFLHVFSVVPVSFLVTVFLAAVAIFYRVMPSHLSAVLNFLNKSWLPNQYYTYHLETRSVDEMFHIWLISYQRSVLQMFQFSCG